MRFLELPHRSVLRIFGCDARQFLHNITTNNILTMSSRGPVYALILNSKGRYVFDFFLVQCGDAFLLECACDDRQDLVALLRSYRLQLKVKVRYCEEYKVGVIMPWESDGEISYAGGIEETGVFFRDPRSVNMGTRVILSASSEFGNGSIVAHKEYEILRIKNAVPDCSKDMLRGESFPLHFGMDRMGAIDFNKGCYIGQEVVARMYRTGSKKGVYTVCSESEFLPGNVKDVFINGRLSGQLLSTVENWGLCVLEKDKVRDEREVLIGSVSAKLYCADKVN